LAGFFYGCIPDLLRVESNADSYSICRYHPIMNADPLELQKFSDLAHQLVGPDV
jgi:hypothetical protein